MARFVFATAMMFFIYLANVQPLMADETSISWGNVKAEFAQDAPAGKLVVTKQKVGGTCEKCKIEKEIEALQAQLRSLRLHLEGIQKHVYTYASTEEFITDFFTTTDGIGYVEEQLRILVSKDILTVKDMFVVNVYVADVGEGLLPSGNYVVIFYRGSITKSVGENITMPLSAYGYGGTPPRDPFFGPTSGYWSAALIRADENGNYNFEEDTIASWNSIPLNYLQFPLSYTVTLRIGKKAGVSLSFG